MANEAQIPISSDFDIVAARQQGRQLALKLGFHGGDVTLIAAAISEMARNIVDHAKQYGYSTRRGLGVGLPGAKWLMDEFDIVSKVGKGTTVTMKKWLT